MTPVAWLLVGMALGFAAGLMIALEYRNRWKTATTSETSYRSRWLDRMGAKEVQQNK